MKNSRMRLIGINLRIGSPNTVRVAVVHANTFKESVHQRSLYLQYKANNPAPIPNRQAIMAPENKILRSHAQYHSILSEKLESHTVLNKVCNRICEALRRLSILFKHLTSKTTENLNLCTKL